MSDLLKHLKIKIEAKERSVSLGHFCTERVESNRGNRFTTSALLTSEESLEKTNAKCVFCNSINHPSWRCLKISNPQHKRTILKRYGLCFICFHKGHLASSYTLTHYSCNKCKGKYNISIFIESKKPNDRNNTRSSGQSNMASMDENNTNHTNGTTNNFTSNTTNNVNNIFLQTAKATATDLNDLSYANIRIKFNSGSQRKYVNEHLKQILNLKTLRTEKLVLKTFGNEKPSEKLFDVVKIKLNGMKKDFVNEVLVIPQICSPITNQMGTWVSQNYPHLKNLRLADSFDEQLMNIDILIGTDFYHTFFTDEIIRGKSNKPVALSSHFGWVLSGNYKVNEKQKSENTHTFFIGNESFCKYEPFNDDSLEMKNCFSHFYPNDIKQISDEENVFDFYK